jgi:hypothetical protein
MAFLNNQYMIVAQIPPPTISHTAARMKNTFAESFFVFRCTTPITKKSMGGANVNKKQMAIRSPIPSIT